MGSNPTATANKYYMIKVLNFIVSIFWYAYQILFNAYLWPERLKKMRQSPQYKARKRICHKIWTYTGLGWIIVFSLAPHPVMIGVAIMLAFSNTFLSFQILEDTIWEDDEE